MEGTVEAMDEDDGSVQVHFAARNHKVWCYADEGEVELVRQPQPQARATADGSGPAEAEAAAAKRATRAALLVERHARGNAARRETARLRSEQARERRALEAAQAREAEEQRKQHEAAMREVRSVRGSAVLPYSTSRRVAVWCVVRCGAVFCDAVCCGAVRVMIPLFASVACLTALAPRRRPHWRLRRRRVPCGGTRSTRGARRRRWRRCGRRSWTSRPSCPSSMRWRASLSLHRSSSTPPSLPPSRTLVCEPTYLPPILCFI